MTSRRGASSVRCVMREPARRKDGRRRALTNQRGCDRNMLWKRRFLSSAAAESRNRTGIRRPQNKRPDRGDNRSGRAIRALGVDGRSRLIQLWGGKTAPTLHWSPPGLATFKPTAKNFNPSRRTVSCASLLRGRPAALDHGGNRRRWRPIQPGLRGFFVGFRTIGGRDRRDWHNGCLDRGIGIGLTGTKQIITSW